VQGTKELLLKVLKEQIEDAEFFNSNYCKMTPVWVFKDTLELLQPAKPPKASHQWDKCNYCGRYVFYTWKWCPYCGRGINWNE